MLKKDKKIQSSFEIKDNKTLNKEDVDIENLKQSTTINNKIEKNKIKENKNEEIILDLKEKQLLAYIKKEYDEKVKLQDMKINSLQKENNEQNIKINSFQKENNEQNININSLRKENEEIKLNNDNL